MKYFFSKIIIFFTFPLLVTFCNRNSTSKEKNYTVGITRNDSITPKNLVKFKIDGKWIDSLIKIIPYSQTDSLRFISQNYHDINDELLQRKIYDNPRVYLYTNKKIYQVKFWFTKFLNQNDSAKFFAIYAVLNSGKVFEESRVSFNKKGILNGINDSPSMSDKFLSPKIWNADTISIDHEI